MQKEFEEFWTGYNGVLTTQSKAWIAFYLNIFFFITIFFNKKVSFYCCLEQIGYIFQINSQGKKNFPQQLNGVKIDLYFPSHITKAVTGNKM